MNIKLPAKEAFLIISLRQFCKKNYTSLYGFYLHSINVLLIRVYILRLTNLLSDFTNTIKL